MIKLNTRKAEQHLLPKQYVLKDNGTFPNGVLPVIHYQKLLDIPFFFPGLQIKRLFRKNNWGNNWLNGIYTYHHYHSVTHEVFAVCAGQTKLQLGGEDGLTVEIEQGDVIVIPAGVAHKNLGKERDVICVGGYPDGQDFDMNYGKPGERPATDYNIAALPVPKSDPVFGFNAGLVKIWRGAPGQ